MYIDKRREKKKREKKAIDKITERRVEMDMRAGKIIAHVWFYIEQKKGISKTGDFFFFAFDETA
jgi:hypothetical protein